MKTIFQSARAATLCVLCLFCVLFASAQQAVFEFSTAHRGPAIGPLHYVFATLNFQTDSKH